MKRKQNHLVLAAAVAVCSMYPVTALPVTAFQSAEGSTVLYAEVKQWTDDGRQYKVTTQTDPLNMRADADPSSAIIGTIPKGAVVTVLQTNGSWGQVQYGSMTGYCAMDWLTLVTQSVPAVVDEPHENDPRENEKIIYNYLTQTLGLTSAAACGIIANMHVETGGSFDPEAHNDPAEGETQGYGICQWNSGEASGYRLEELQAFSPDWKKLEVQLEFIRQDLIGNSYLLALHLYDDLKALGNTEVDAVAASDRWAICYEGCAEWTYAERREKARLYYAEHNGAGVQWRNVNMTCIIATESGSLNMRSSASPFGSIMMTIPKDAEVAVKSISDDGKWAQVEYRGTTGYCAMEYLKQTVPASSEDEAYTRGDVNGNTIVDADDAQITLTAYTERITGNAMKLTAVQINAADIDGNGLISSDDAQLILMYYTAKYVSRKAVTWEQLLSS